MSDIHSLFARVIQDHLELKERNSELDPVMPLDRYTTEDPFGTIRSSSPRSRRASRRRWTAPSPQSHSCLRLPWPGEETGDVEELDLDDSLWGRSREFDWGD